ncbi:MAG: hypothetical protein KAS07_03240 [Candidatus Pacebacteria bacterium]|nr:hypothetical protein [Candidatus Paceibacterota bacterium]
MDEQKILAEQQKKETKKYICPVCKSEMVEEKAVGFGGETKLVCPKNCIPFGTGSKVGFGVY